MNDTLEQQIQKLERSIADDPQSPLFARLADCYLAAGRSQDALTVCDNGLAHHPFYTTGHLLKGKALLALNMKSEARREFEFVHEMLPFNEAVERLLAAIPVTPEDSFVAPGTRDLAAAESSPRAEEPPTESPLTPEASAEQVLSQFTEEQPPAVETASEETPTEEAQPVVGEMTSEIPAPSGEEIFETAQTEEVFAPPTVQQESKETDQPEPVEPFEVFSDRKRMELFGLENSMSLEEYLAERTTGEESAGSGEIPAVESASPDSPIAVSPAEEETTGDPFAALTQYEEQQSPPEVMPSSDEAANDVFSQLQDVGEETPAGSSEEPQVVAPTETTEDPFALLHQEAEPPAEEPPVRTADDKDDIEQLAEKLKDAKRITPVINLSDRTVTPSSEEDTPSGTGFVTPTLAEIYAKQGWLDDAIKAYKTLATTKPAEREKYEARIRELEEQKRNQEGA